MLFGNFLTASNIININTKYIIEGAHHSVIYYDTNRSNNLTTATTTKKWYIHRIMPYIIYTYPMLWYVYMLALFIVTSSIWDEQNIALESDPGSG